MVFQTARTLTDFMYRGTRYELTVKIYEERYGEDDAPFNLEGHTVSLILADSWVDNLAVLKLEGSVVGASDGEVLFVFEPDDTKDLPVQAYDLTVYVYDTQGKPWVAVQGRFGILGAGPEEVSAD